MLPEIDIEGQEKLAEASIAIIGLGGLGSPSSIYLTASGIGVLNLFDDDVVELSNLQRQIIFDSSDIGERKNLVAKKKLLNLNENIVCNSFSKCFIDPSIFVVKSFKFIISLSYYNFPVLSKFLLKSFPQKY